MKTPYRSKIVIVTNDCDFHADHIIENLRSRGVEPIRIHPGSFPLGGTASFNTFSQDSEGWMSTDDSVVKFGDIKSVWYRRPQPPEFPSTWSPQEKRFARSETVHVTNGIFEALDCFWMSRPSRLQLAENKLVQLRQAIKLGVKVPKTLVTTKPEDLNDFFKLCKGKVIYKTLSGAALGVTRDFTSATSQIEDETRYTKTTLLDASHLVDHGQEISHAPCLFQEYVEKAYELRVTIIGDSIFPVKIDSQSQEETKIDWRHYDVPMRLSMTSLPNEIAAFCRRFVADAGLTFSTMDFVVTPQNDFVFLENNPNGQWLWVEKMIPGIGMTEALLSCLIAGAAAG